MHKDVKRELVATLLESAYVEAAKRRDTNGRQCMYFRLTIHVSDNEQIVRIFRDLVKEGCVISGQSGTRWTLMGKRAWRVYEQYRELLSPEKRAQIEYIASSCNPQPWEPSRAGRPRKVAA